MKTRQIIVIGGGASGLMAAISAARAGANVIVLEQKNRIGKKILSTGNGRCNFTNQDMKLEYFRGDNPNIVQSVLDQFGWREAIQFFEELGVLHKSRNGYFYPISDQASTILDALRIEIERLLIEVRVEECVQDIVVKKNGFSVKTNKRSYTADAVVLATGGMAAPALGSDGSGYSMAKALGHSISTVVPALVQLRCKGDYFKQLAGVRMNAKVRLYVEECCVAEDVGELQLTDYGISGIPVFQVSRYAAKALHKKQAVRAELNFLPEFTEKTLALYMEQRVAMLGERNMEDFLLGMFHKKLITVLLKKAGIATSTKAKGLGQEAFNRLCKTAQHFMVEVIGTNSFAQAQVCAGGVRTDEVNAQTMESIYVKDLYLTGELLDVDGICGGYNLQWAWASGFLAGKYAAKG